MSNCANCDSFQMFWSNNEIYVFKSWFNQAKSSVGELVLIFVHILI